MTIHLKMNLEFMLEAVSGDLILRAPSGRVRIEGQNVDIIAGYDGQTGIINIDANDKILMRLTNH